MAEATIREEPAVADLASGGGPDSLYPGREAVEENVAGCE